MRIKEKEDPTGWCGPSNDLYKWSAIVPAILDGINMVARINGFF